MAASLLTTCRSGGLIATLLMSCASCATLQHDNVPVTRPAAAIQAPPATRVLGQATVYLSPSGERLETVHDPRSGVAIVKLPDGNLAILPAEIAGSEQRYRNDRMMLWENDGAALLWNNGQLLFNGRETNPAGN